jgi:hypothetical protein
MLQYSYIRKMKETGTNSYLQIQTFWDVMLCQMVHSYQQFR